MGNTPCGREAAAHLRMLVRGGVRLEEDPTLTFDARGRRMYYAFTRDGRPLAPELVTAGVAQALAAGRESAQLRQAEAAARMARRGCVWGGPLTTTAAPRTAAATTASSTAVGGFAQDVLVSGLTNPTNFAYLPDGRILIAEQNGLVRLYKDGALSATPFLDL